MALDTVSAGSFLMGQKGGEKCSVPFPEQVTLLWGNMCNIQIIYTVTVFKHFTNLRFVCVAGCIGCLAILCFPT